MSTFAAPVVRRTRWTKDAISADDCAIESVPPTGIARGCLAVGEGEGAVALRGEERAEVRVVSWAVATEPVQQDERVRVRGRRFARPVVEP